MKLYMPTEVYSEKNCVFNHSRELAALGSHALIVTGKHSSRINGSLEDVTAALERENIPYLIFDRIEENPSVETVMKACSLGLQDGADFVIGVGGGSPMDAAKAIALMMANPEQDAGFLYAKPEKSGLIRPALPVACVPTTAGTGSEVTPYSILTRSVLPEIVLTTLPENIKTTALSGSESISGMSNRKGYNSNTNSQSGYTSNANNQPGNIPNLAAASGISFPHLEKKTKHSISHRIFPRLALVDVTYLQTASKSGCINTAVDTLAHLIESHLNTNSTDYSRFYSEMGLRTWAKVKDKLLRYEIGEDERRLLMNACTLGGIAIAHTGTSLPHGLSYSITCEMGIPHGKAVGIFLPGFLRSYGDREEAMRVLSLLDFGSEQTFAEYIRQLLGEVTISDSLWEEDVEGLLSNPTKRKNYPFLLDKEKLWQMRG